MKWRSTAAAFVILGIVVAVFVGVRSARNDERRAWASEPQAVGRAGVALREFCRKQSIDCSHLVAHAGVTLDDGDTFELEWVSPTDPNVAFLAKVPPLPGRVDVRPLSGAIDRLRGQVVAH